MKLSALKHQIAERRIIIPLFLFALLAGKRTGAQQIQFASSVRGCAGQYFI